jgi:hypothetical protein
MYYTQHCPNPELICVYKTRFVGFVGFEGIPDLQDAMILDGIIINFPK